MCQKYLFITYYLTLTTTYKETIFQSLMLYVLQKKHLRVHKSTQKYTKNVLFLK